MFCCVWGFPIPLMLFDIGLRRLGISDFGSHVSSSELRCYNLGSISSDMPYSDYLNPWVLFFKMTFWVGLNSNFAAICTFFAIF